VKKRSKLTELYRILQNNTEESLRGRMSRAREAIKQAEKQIKQYKDAYRKTVQNLGSHPAVKAQQALDEAIIPEHDSRYRPPPGVPRDKPMWNHRRYDGTDPLNPMPQGDFTGPEKVMLDAEKDRELNIANAKKQIAMHKETIRECESKLKDRAHVDTIKDEIRQVGREVNVASERLQNTREAWLNTTEEYKRLGDLSKF